MCPFATESYEPPSEASSRASTYVVRVEEGPDRGASLLVHPSAPSRLYVGASPGCDLPLSDRQVSRRHLALEHLGRHLRLTDLGSLNGTQVGGVLVVDALLRGGEVVRIGSTALTVHVQDAVRVPDAPARERFGRLVGASAEMQRIYPLCARLAAADVPVIIEGETGTGKEVLAEALHEEGPRASAPFVVFDCTAVPENLVESELFGHERGAFTGAVTTRKGVFEQAHGGTLLIDEIGDLSLTMQPKLLRVLERSEVRRVGGDRPIKVDVRVLFATRRDLDHLVETGAFRDDLFHRMSVGRVELPPLRRRTGDITRLARHFASAITGTADALSDALLLRWETDPWPGNVRALRNAVARQLALGDLAMLPREDGPREPAGAALPGGAAPAASSAVAPASGMIERILSLRLPIVHARERVVAEFERLYVEQVLADHGGNVSRAAEASGIARRHFQRIKARG